MVQTELQISTYLNQLFGQSWVYSVSMDKYISSTNGYNFYVLSILSFSQMDTESVFYLQSMYNIIKLQIFTATSQILFNRNISAHDISDSVQLISNADNMNQICLCKEYENITESEIPFDQLQSCSTLKTTLGITCTIFGIVIMACGTVLLYQWISLRKYKLEMEPGEYIYSVNSKSETSKKDKKSRSKSKPKSKSIKAITTDQNDEPESARNSKIKIVNSLPDIDESIHIDFDPNFSLKGSNTNTNTSSGRSNTNSNKTEEHQKQQYYGVPAAVADHDESVYVSTINAGQVIKTLRTITAEDEHYVNIDQEHQRNSSTFKADKQITNVLDIAGTKKNLIEYEDFKQQFKLVKLIGKGSFGRVYKGLHEGNEVAVKIFNQLDERHFMEVEQKIEANLCKSKELYSEIILATSIPPHPNIIRITGFSRKPLCVVMEYMAGGSVQKLVYGLSSKPIPSIAEKLHILIKACYGFGKLTEYGLHHRDIAARNILLGSYDDEIDEDTKVKITDFGMTREKVENDKILKTSTDGGPYKWMAPESIQKQVYNEKTDVYMFGM